MLTIHRRSNGGGYGSGNVNGYGGGYSNGSAGGYGGGSYGGGAGGDRMSNLGANLQKQQWGKSSLTRFLYRIY